MGPSRPSTFTSGSATEILQSTREEEQDRKKLAKAYWKNEAKSKREETNAERATGRERTVEKRWEGNAVRREYADEREGGGMMDVDEETLMGGGGGGFKAM